MTVMCILWVANMALACSSTNTFWHGNLVTGLILTAYIANQGL